MMWSELLFNESGHSPSPGSLSQPLAPSLLFTSFISCRAKEKSNKKKATPADNDLSRVPRVYTTACVPRPTRAQLSSEK